MHQQYRQLPYQKPTSITKNESRFVHFPEGSTRAQYRHMPIHRKKVEMDPKTPKSPQ
jgi:hypothetical protein